MKALLTVICAFGAALGLAVSASAAETIAYWPFGTNGFHDVSGNGHDEGTIGGAWPQIIG